MDNQPGTAVVTRPADFLKQYADSFTAACPSHVDRRQWLAVAIDAVRRDPEVERAAMNDLRRFAAAVRQAARRGLEPGTEQFYLVPFAPKKGQPKVIEGIVGYQGLVELMYRSGAVQSVVCELVHSNDTFTYRPGADERPTHVVDWFGGGRGDLIGAYAYAVMEGGATSKVVVMGSREIEQVKRSSASAGSERSPWNTNPGGMWLKTVARQLSKWVPTSAEYRRQKLRDASAVWDESVTPARPDAGPADEYGEAPPDGGRVDPLTGEITFDIVDAEIVEEPPSAPPPDGPPYPTRTIDRRQRRRLWAAMRDIGLTEEAEANKWAAAVLGRPVGSFAGLAADEADLLIGEAEGIARAAETGPLSPAPAAGPTPDGDEP